MSDRITFPGNPWPEGHAVEACVLSGTLHPDRGVRLQLHLESADYSADRRVADTDEVVGDWGSPGVWDNYHACMLSSTAWGWDRTSGLAAAAPFDVAALDGRYRADLLEPGRDIDADHEPAFGIYLLGHDAVVDHDVILLPGDLPGRWDLRWTGRIALAYAGDLTPRHTFEATVADLAFGGLLPVDLATAADARAALEQHTVDPDRWDLEGFGRGLIALRSAGG